MSNGKIGVAPCGHRGEAVIGHFYRCTEGCEDDAVPRRIKSEKTKRMCPNCGHDHVEIYPGMSTVAGQELYHCHGCFKAFLS